MSDRRDPDVHQMVMEWPDDAVAEIESLQARVEMLLGLLDVRESELVAARSRLADKEILLAEAVEYGTGYKQAYDEAMANYQMALARLAEIAAIAHDGGLRGMSEADALVAIRRLTLPHWNKSTPRAK